VRRRLKRETLIERRVLVSSDGVTAHITGLIKAGWKRIEIARTASVSPALITKASRPGNGLEERTAQRILQGEMT
jgi:hypothetical protein